MTQDVSEATIVNAAVLPTIAHQSFLYSRALLNDDLFLHRFLSSPNRDLYSLLDDDLKYKLEYAWTLPLNTRFITRMKSIQDGVNELLPATECLKSSIYYFIRRIREIVIVSTYISLSSTSLDLDTGPQERIELHRMLIEPPIFDDGLDLLDHHPDPCDDELPGLID